MSLPKQIPSWCIQNFSWGREECKLSTASRPERRNGLHKATAARMAALRTVAAGSTRHGE